MNKRIKYSVESSVINHVILISTTNLINLICKLFNNLLLFYIYDERKELKINYFTKNINLKNLKCIVLPSVDGINAFLVKT